MEPGWVLNLGLVILMGTLGSITGSPTPRMDVPRFALFTTIGCAVWVSALSAIGYALGTSWESVTKGFGVAGYLVAGTSWRASCSWRSRPFWSIASGRCGGRRMDPAEGGSATRPSERR